MKIVLASKSGVRKEILSKNNIKFDVFPSNINESEVKESLIANGASPLLISKNLAELKANKVSLKKPDQIVLGADSVIDLDGELISKPNDRNEALNILQKLNGKSHKLISSVCISKNGSMIWNYTDSSTLTMKQLNLDQIKAYLEKIQDEKLFSYGVYQIEADGKSLFSEIKGDENTIMGLPVKEIIKYLNKLK
tara:strand:- start:2917 stop:3498 length:582 start_codon:yes stop_codon:yes gene_type:complete